MQLYMCDTNPAVTHALREVFGSNTDEVKVLWGNILEHAADAIVSPANSHGFMDGGIDRAYRDFFGQPVQERLQELIVRNHGGELVVGTAQTVATDHPQIPIMISAPTMRVPADVSQTVNAYLALRAALIAARRYNAVVRRHDLAALANERDPRVWPVREIRTILCPGLGTSVGRMPPERAALQMKAAWLDFNADAPLLATGTATDILVHHAEMMRCGLTPMQH